MPDEPVSLLDHVNPFMGKIAAALGIALALSLVTILVLLARLDGCNESQGELTATVRGHVANDVTQEKSIADLSAALDRKNGETEARAAELTAARQREAQATVQMDAKAAAARSQIETLNRLAKSGNSVCGVTDELREALNGL